MRGHPRRDRRKTIPIVFLAGAASILAAAASEPDAAPVAEADRASWAVGASAGASLHDLLPISIEHFRQGLLDGLGGDATRTRVMERPELFERMRAVLKRVAEAEVAAVAERIDRDGER